MRYSQFAEITAVLSETPPYVAHYLRFLGTLYRCSDDDNFTFSLLATEYLWQCRQYSGWKCIVLLVAFCIPFSRLGHHSSLKNMVEPLFIIRIIWNQWRERFSIYRRNQFRYVAPDCVFLSPSKWWHTFFIRTSYSMITTKTAQNLSEDHYPFLKCSFLRRSIRLPWSFCMCTQIASTRSSGDE